MGNQRRNPVRTGCARSMFPVAVAAQCVDKRERLFTYQEIGMIGGRAEQVERQRGIGLDQPHQQALCRFDGRSRRSRVGFALAGLDKGRSGSSNLRLARKKQAEAGLQQPRLCVVQRQQGFTLLSPQGRAGCEKLFGCQRKPFSCAGGIWCMALRRPPKSSEKPAGYPSKNTLMRSGGHAGSSSGVRFWPVPPAATPCVWGPAAY